MALRLVKGSYKYRDQMIEMLKEWIAYNNAHPEANPSPAAIFKNDYHDFDHYLSHLDYMQSRMADWFRRPLFSAWMMKEISWWAQSISVTSLTSICCNMAVISVMA